MTETYVLTTRSDIQGYKQRVDLDGVEFVLALSWNPRDEHWVLSLALADGTPVASGIRVVANAPLLQFVSHPQRPLGELKALDTSGAGNDPGLTELGGRVLLLYQSAAE